MKKPLSLHSGDLVSICAPASPPLSLSAFDDARHLLQTLGYRVKFGKRAKKRNGYLAGTDNDRALDLIDAFQDPSVKAIFCIRGGYGSARTLPLLLANRFPQKLLIGFSDITALQCGLLQRGYRGNIHAPLFSLKNKLNREIFTRLVTGDSKFGIRDYLSASQKKKLVPIRKGKATGTLLTVNLTVLVSLIGTPYFPNLKGTLLLIEDVNEAPYRVDRALTQLILSGALKGVKGIGIGEFTAEKKQSKHYQSFDDVFSERLSSLKIPILKGIPFGHVGLKLPIPIGIKGMLDAVHGDLIILESSVRSR